MDVKVEEMLDELAQLKLSKVSKEIILEKAVEIKQYIQKLRNELLDAEKYVDATLNIIRVRIGVDSGKGTESAKLFIRPGTISAAVTDKTRVLLIAQNLAVDGRVKTKDIINELKSKGDTRPERDMAKSISNTLARNKWEAQYPGVYKKSPE
jgi:hypothetical protein